MNGKELRCFSHFPILTKIHTLTLAETFKLTNLEIVFIHCKAWKSVKMIKFNCKDDLQVFS